MRWPWGRKREDAAEAAKDDAGARYRDAKSRKAQVDRAVRSQQEQARRTDRFFDEVERSMHYKRGTA